MEKIKKIEKELIKSIQDYEESYLNDFISLVKNNKELVKEAKKRKDEIIIYDEAGNLDIEYVCKILKGILNEK